MQRKLISTISGQEYPFERIQEFAENGESLEVSLDTIKIAHIKEGKHIWQRFADFLPFEHIDASWSLGEGNTPLLDAGVLKTYTGIDNLLLKNETVNPTWSFKDRGSLTCVAMAKEMGEKQTATISTGNMGSSIAAYAARAGLRVIVFVPAFAPKEKIMAMAIHGAIVIKVDDPDYAKMKTNILGLAERHRLRIVSGNGPIRTEGYKLTAFEMYEQLNGEVPDYIAVPTSACGHIRGLFKGYRELVASGLTKTLPKMIIIQAANNSPLVSAIKQGKKELIPFSNFHTVAEAITSGNPPGGNEIIDKAYTYGWLAEDVTEEEILASQQTLAQAGFFVEPATATTVVAVKKLREAGKIKQTERVVLMLTGSGLKDFDVFQYHKLDTINTTLENVEDNLKKVLTT